MAGVEVIDEAIWGSDEPRVLAPPHLRADGEKLEEGLRARDEARGALVFATSGTTGTPKWILHTRTSLLASARMVNEHLQVSPSDHWLLALPVCHVGGFGVVARAHQVGVAHTRLEGKWIPEAFMAALQAARVTLTSLVPTQVHDLVAAGLCAPATLRAVLVGGGHLPPAMGKRARDLGWPVLPTYGLTEAGSQVATAPLSALADGDASGPLELLRGWEARIDEEGCLEIRGDALCRGVMRVVGEEIQISPHDPSEFWATGDVVTLSGRGMTVRGRNDRVIKIRGELVNLDELEEDLNHDLDGVGVFYLLSIPDERLGNRLVPVALHCAPGKGAEVVEALNARLPGYARLDAPETVSSVPQTPAGKVDYVALEKLLGKSAR